MTRARRFLTSSWLWAGVALSLLIFLPNLIWQIQHDFVSLESWAASTNAMLPKGAPSPSCWISS